MILLIYDSVFGNTLKIANEIVNQLRIEHKVPLLRHVNDLTPEDITNADLILFGSPTRAFRPSVPMMTLLKHVGKSLASKKVTCFDTRIDTSTIQSKFLHQMVRWFGYANDYFVKQFKRFGALLITEPAYFFVKDSAGPLAEMALSQAIEFAERIAKV